MATLTLAFEGGNGVGVDSAFGYVLVRIFATCRIGRSRRG